jgi:hypothetical protein
MLQYYSPSPHDVAHFAHISTFHQHPSSCPPDGGNFGLLPSVSKSHISSLRHTPSNSPLPNIDVHYAPLSPFNDQNFRNDSRNS